MVSLHDKIVNILARRCRVMQKDSGKPFYKNVYADHAEGFEKVPLPITLVRRGGSLIENYNPDVWGKYPVKGVDVYEVWHKESVGEAINDIIFSSLVKNIRYMHIVCTGDNISKERARDLADLFLNKIHDKKGELILHPTNVWIAEIPEKIHNDKKKIENQLIEQLRL